MLGCHFAGSSCSPCDCWNGGTPVRGEDPEVEAEEPDNVSSSLLLSFLKTKNGKNDRLHCLFVTVRLFSATGTHCLAFHVVCPCGVKWTHMRPHMDRGGKTCNHQPSSLFHTAIRSFFSLFYSSSIIISGMEHNDWEKFINIRSIVFEKTFETWWMWISFSEAKKNMEGGEHCWKTYAKMMMNIGHKGMDRKLEGSKTAYLNKIYNKI